MVRSEVQRSGTGSARSGGRPDPRTLDLRTWTLGPPDRTFAPSPHRPLGPYVTRFKSY